MRVFYARRNWYALDVLSSEHAPQHLWLRFVRNVAGYLFRNLHSIQPIYIQLPSTAPAACPGLKQSQSLEPSGFQQMGNRCAHLLESNETP
jgi:hypothetical protein